MATIKPEVLSGFRDLLPAEALIQERLLSIIRRVFESYGFVPLDTPALEKIDVLTGADKNFNKSLFVAEIRKGAEDRKNTDADWEGKFGLRFDLTVPLARIVSSHPELPKPFKCYQIGKVWRGERAQAGRYREFYQCDCDIAGSDSILSDVEIILVMQEIMLALGFDDFTFRLNTRNILSGLAEIIGVKKRSKDFFRIIDKIDKTGVNSVLTELKTNFSPEGGKGFNLWNDQIWVVKEFLALRGDTPRKTISSLTSFFKNKSFAGEKGVEELKSISSLLSELNVPDRRWAIDPSIARGLDYYTGPVFEVVLNNLRKLGSVISGGRYDGLTNRFMANSNIPAVGASIGLTRLLEAMRKLNLMDQRESLSDILVTVYTGLEAESLKIADSLRKIGLNVEVYNGKDSSFRSQFAFAAKKTIPFVVVVGPNEVKNEVVQLKDMNARKQETLSLEELLLRFKK